MVLPSNGHAVPQQECSVVLGVHRDELMPQTLINIMHGRIAVRILRERLEQEQVAPAALVVGSLTLSGSSTCGWHAALRRAGSCFVLRSWRRTHDPYSWSGSQSVYPPHARRAQATAAYHCTC